MLRIGLTDMRYNRSFMLPMHSCMPAVGYSMDMPVNADKNRCHLVWVAQEREETARPQVTCSGYTREGPRSKSGSGSWCPAWRRAVIEGSDIAKVSSACYCHLHQLRQICHRVGAEVTTQLVLALVISRLDYCNTVLASVLQSTLEPLQYIQNAAACLVHQLHVQDHVTPSLIMLHWLHLCCRINLNYAWSCTEYTLSDAQHISKTSSLRPAAQQHILAYNRLPATSTWRHGCNPSLENAPSSMRDLLHGIHCHLTFMLQPN